MAKVSLYLGTKLLDHALRGVTYRPPDSIWLALFITQKGKVVEVEATSYSRQPIAFDEPKEGQIVNSVEVAFPRAEEAWGVVTHIGLYDDAVNGHLLLYGAIERALITKNDQYIFDVGKFMVGLGNA